MEEKPVLARLRGRAKSSFHMNLPKRRQSTEIKDATISADFSPEMAIEDVQSTVSSYGLVTNIIKPSETKPWQITFGSELQAICAAAQLNGRLINGAKLSVFCLGNEKVKRATKVIEVRSIPETVQESEVRLAFQRFGDIISSQRLPTAKKTWKMVIEYATFDAARDAVDGMDGQELEEDTKPITVKFSVRKLPQTEKVRKFRKKLSSTAQISCPFTLLSKV